MSIQLLDQSTINKIAAGEVIERPSSVVKELVENAIDAGATAVTVEIKDGGISYIRVTDNGCGIARDELEIAFERHATSKIKSLEDLLTVSSLGFRGEALASIAAVSQVELTTKIPDSLNGYRYVCEGGKKKILEETGAPDGTTFVVRNLFFNTPVRRKFLKSVNSEAGLVGTLVQYLALSHPDISFRFINNNQDKLHTSGNMTLKDIIYSIYGRDITANLYDIDTKTQDISISGFIGKPAICRGNRTYENYYINGRYIKSNIISKAIEEAYKGFIMPHNYPFTAIHFTINPLIMDVNVHPTKMELRFSNNEFVYDFVYRSILDRLRSNELVTRVSVDSRIPDMKHDDTKLTEMKLADMKLTEMKHADEKSAYANENGKKSGEVEAVIEKPSEVNVTEARPTQAKNTNEHFSGVKNVCEKPACEEPSYVKSDYGSVAYINNSQSKLEDAAVHEDSEKYNEKPQQMSFFENKLLDSNSNYTIIGQLFNTYWLIEFEDKFYIMDQHAAHEKVLYEKLMKHLAQKKMMTQEVYPPIIVSFNIREKDALDNNMDILKNLGYELENFGGNEYKIVGIPASLPKMDYKQMLIDIVDSLVNEVGNSTPELITQKVASMSCKAAVKGNNKLSRLEVEELMKELMQADNPYNCPHGRPTLILMTKYDIERKFKRIL